MKLLAGSWTALQLMCLSLNSLNNYWVKVKPFSGILMTVWVHWYIKNEGVYFLGLKSIFKGFDSFTNTEGVHCLIVYLRL